MDRSSPEAALRPLEPVASDDPRLNEFAKLLGIVDRLREPDGCPWDREQTLTTMTPHIIEEAHELSEAIHRGDDNASLGEAGDLLLNVLLVARIAEDENKFGMAELCEAISSKLIRRHPHVFGTVKAETSAEVLGNWEEIKKGERETAQEDMSALAGIPSTMPALLQAMRMSGKAVSAGFSWHNVGGALAKLHEELGELEEALPSDALESHGPPELDAETWRAIDHEAGDTMMAAAFLSAYLGRDPEVQLKSAMRRFESRFRAMERALEGNLKRDLDQLLVVWRDVKKRESEEKP